MSITPSVALATFGAAAFGTGFVGLHHVGGKSVDFAGFCRSLFLERKKEDCLVVQLADGQFVERCGPVNGGPNGRSVATASAELAAERQRYFEMGKFAGAQSSLENRVGQQAKPVGEFGTPVVPGTCTCTVTEMLDFYNVPSFFTSLWFYLGDYR